MRARLELEMLNDTTFARMVRSLQGEESELFKSAGSFIFNRHLLIQNEAVLSAANYDVDVNDLTGMDVGAGAGLDNLGLSQANTAIHYFWVRNRSTSAGNLVLNVTVANGWTNWLGGSVTRTLAPGASIREFSTTGITVAAGTNDQLRITASGGDINFDLEWLGSGTP